MSNEHLGIVEEGIARRQWVDKLKQREAPASGYTAPRHRPPPLIPNRLRQGGYWGKGRTNNGKRRKTYPEGELGLNLLTVVQAVVSETGLTHAELLRPARSRTRPLRSRYVLAWALDRYCPDYSLNELGYLFDHKDHTSVMHNIRRTQELLEEGHPEVTLLVANLRLRLAAIAVGGK